MSNNMDNNNNMNMAVQILDLWDNSIYADYVAHITTIFTRPTIDDALIAIEWAMNNGLVVGDFFGKSLNYNIGCIM